MVQASLAVGTHGFKERLLRDAIDEPVSQTAPDRLPRRRSRAKTALAHKSKS
jgi:hypothetical protein